MEFCMLILTISLHARYSLIDCRNPGGIRFGSSEIYDVLDACFSPLPTRDSADTIEDALAVGQAIEGGTDERVILFVKLSARRKLSIDLEKKIKVEIRSRRSPRHVPARVSEPAFYISPPKTLLNVCPRCV